MPLPVSGPAAVEIDLRQHQPKKGVLFALPDLNRQQTSGKTLMRCTRRGQRSKTCLQRDLFLWLCVKAFLAWAAFVRQVLGQSSVRDSIFWPVQNCIELHHPGVELSFDWLMNFFFFFLVTELLPGILKATNAQNDKTVLHNVNTPWTTVHSLSFYT